MCCGVTAATSTRQGRGHEDPSPWVLTLTAPGPLLLRYQRARGSVARVRNHTRLICLMIIFLGSN
jgi:hypothetical protein